MRRNKLQKVKIKLDQVITDTSDSESPGIKRRYEKAKSNS